MLYSVNCRSTKTFKFHSGILRSKYASNYAVSAVYRNGVFYCLFRQGQLGAFDVELEEWRIIFHPWQPMFFPFPSQLIVFDANLIWVWKSISRCKCNGDHLYKFDLSKKRCVYDNNKLDNHVLFIGEGPCFAVPAVGEISQLANTVVSCDPHGCGVKCFIREGPCSAVPAVGEISQLANTAVSCDPHGRGVKCYDGSTSHSDERGESLLYRNCIEAQHAKGWIEPPSGRVWKADDLNKALQ